MCPKLKTGMHSKRFVLTWTLLGLSLCLSCNKEPQYPTKTVAVPYDETYDLARLYPELETSPFIKYDANKGYYLVSEERQWNLSYTDTPIDFQTLTWDSVPLPSFLCGDNAGVTLTNPGVFIENRNDFPVYASVDAIVFNGKGKAEFVLSDNGTSLYLAQEDAIDRDPVRNREVQALGPLFRAPFADGELLLPSLSVRPNTLDEEAFTRKEEYRLQLTASWMIPLAFAGDIQVEGAPTLPVTLDGASLGAPGNHRHRIKQNLENKYLPFDCRITPVFTMEGKQPVYLDSFILKNEEQVEYSYEFCPSEDHWKATFHYLVSPARGRDEFFSKDHGYLRIWYTKFTANLENAD